MHGKHYDQFSLIAIGCIVEKSAIEKRMQLSGLIMHPEDWAQSNCPAGVYVSGRYIPIHPTGSVQGAVGRRFKTMRDHDVSMGVKQAEDKR